MTPVEALAEHQARPRHLGRIKDPNLTGEVGSIVVGDAMRLYLRLEGGVIQDAGFQVFGAQPMLASTSVLCDVLIGKSAQQALALTVDDLCAQVGGVPRERLPVLPWGLEALKVALAKQGLGEVPVDQDRERLICRCLGIDEESIREAVEDDGCRDVQAVIDATQAGSACGSCRQDIQKLIDAILGQAKPKAAPSAGGVAGRLARLKQMQSLVQLVLQPEVPVRIEPWDWQGQQVILRAEAGATPEVLERARARAEAIFRKDVSPDLTVIIQTV